VTGQGRPLRQNIASRAYEIERRTLVGFACALVVLHAFLAALAWPLPRAQADAAFAICHAGGGAGDTSAPDPAGDKPNILCGLCAQAIGAALPPGTVAIGPCATAYAAIHHDALAPIRVAAVPVRAGAARAPPG
jgi:hypothetical protein